MAKRKPNPAIGDCPCPVTGCGLRAEVKKFERRAALDTGTRMAGRLYLICPTHGRLGADGREAMQDFILENATIWDDRHAPEPAPAPDASSSAPPRPPSPAPKPPPAPTPKPWGFFR